MREARSGATERRSRSRFPSRRRYLEAEASFLLRAREFNDIGLKNSRSQTMLQRIAANPAIRKPINRKKHESDIPPYPPADSFHAQCPAPNGRLDAKIAESDVQRFVRDPQNFSALCEYMRDQIAVETRPAGFLRTKHSFRRTCLGNCKRYWRLLI